MNWKEWSNKHLPFLIKKCPAGNTHWKWEKFCTCGAGPGKVFPRVYNFKTRAWIIAPSYYPMCRCHTVMENEK